MDDIDIEPPEAPVLNETQAPPADSTPDDVPLPPPQLQKKKGFLQKLFVKQPKKIEPKKEEPLPQPEPPKAETPSPEPLPPPISPPSAEPTFENMVTSEPVEPKGPQDELLPLPDVDNLYDEHAQDLEQLKKKLGDEFVVPKEVHEFDIELNEQPTIGEMLKKKPVEQKPEPVIIELEHDEQPLPPSSPLLGMKGRIEKKKMTIETIATQPNPFAEFKEQEKILTTTPELPEPLPQGRYLSEEEVRQIIAGMQKGNYAKYNTTIQSYLSSLDAELKEIVRSPYASKKPAPQKDTNIQLFFKLHKATNTGELIKLLKTLEFIYKVDLNTLAIRNGKDIEDWLKRFIEAERMKDDHDLIENQLAASFDAAFKEFKRSVEFEKNELDHLYARLTKEKEAIEDHKRELTAHREDLLRDKDNHDSLVEAKVKAVQAELAKKELAMRKDYDQRFQKLTKSMEEFEKLKKKQDLDIYAELQKVEKIKLEVEAEEMDLDEERIAFEKDKKAFRLEQKNTFESTKKQLADMRDEEKTLRKSIIDQRVRLERIQKDFDERIKKQYFTMSNNLGKEKLSFQDFRDKELERLNNVRTALEKEKTDVMALKDELTRQEERIKAMLSEQKTQIRTDLDEMRKIDMNLEQVEVNIRRQKESLEKEGFQRYIQAKLQEVNPASTEHVEIAHTLVEEHELEKALYKDINDLVEECKRLISQRKIAEAKAMYNTIRERYAHSDLNKNEKSMLYNQIRELYDDIHLQDL